MKPKTSRSGRNKPDAAASSKPTSPWTDALHTAWVARETRQQAHQDRQSVNIAAREALTDTYNG